MIGRRTFLQTALAASMLPTLSWAAAPRCVAGLCVIVDGACGDARSFAGRCGVAAQNGSDYSAVLAILMRDNTRTGFGLTRDSQFFLIEQMAGDFGYRLGYHGIHDYRDGGLRHRLTGARNRLSSLAPALRLAGAAWPAALATNMAALSDDTTRNARLEVQALAARPADSGGYLVSWCLHRA